MLYPTDSTFNEDALEANSLDIPHSIAENKSTIKNHIKIDKLETFIDLKLLDRLTKNSSKKVLRWIQDF